MAQVKVEISHDNAVLLLDAAEKAGEPPEVVGTSNNQFVVDEKIAKAAGVDYTTEADERKAFADRLKADDEASGYKRTAKERTEAAKSVTDTSTSEE